MIPCVKSSVYTKNTVQADHFQGEKIFKLNLHMKLDNFRLIIKSVLWISAF